MSFRTEDQVRDESKLILGFNEQEKNIIKRMIYKIQMAG